MKNLIILISALSLCSCASMKEAWIEQNCTKDASYAQGMNDARNQLDMEVNKYTGNCPNSAEVTTSYREGYAEGLKSLHVDDGFNNNGTIINVGIGNGNSIGIGGVKKPNEKPWFCEVSAFTDHFEAFGTKLEATKNVKDQCTAKHHEIHCSNVKCKKNI